MKVWALPSALTWARERSAIAHDDARRTPWRTNPYLGNDDTDGRACHQACSAADGPSPIVPQSTTGVQSPLRSVSASPRTGRGTLSDTSAPMAPNEASGRDDATLCGAYACLTNRCWAKLVRLSERPDQHELVDLQEKSLQAFIKAAGGTYGNNWRKPRLAKALLDWLE